MKKISTTQDAREYLINHLKKQIVGPLDGHFEKNIPSFQFCPNDLSRHKQEVLKKPPRQIYSAGILYPQQNENVYEEINEDDNENLDIDEIEDQINEELLSDDIKIYDDLSEINLTEQKDNNKEEDLDEESADNNFDIDLTNELKQSAIGISVLVKINKPLLIGIKDIGRYFKLAKEPSKTLLIACYYLSKFSNNKSSYNWFYNEYNLENNQRNTILKFLEKKFTIKSSIIKASYEDYFDKFFSHREGWKNRNNFKLDLIANELKNFSKEDLEVIIKKSLVNNINHDEKNIFFGYGRESFSAEVLINEQEIQEKKYFIKKLKKNEVDIGLSFSIVVRNHKDKNKKYLTISLINTNVANGSKIANNKCFFQSNFYIKPKNFDNDLFCNFEIHDYEDLAEEDQSLHLLHHNRKSYGIGHGCSVTWKHDENNSLTIYSAIIPEFETKPIKPKKFEDINLNMKIFSEDINFAIDQLKKLTERYDKWLDGELEKGTQFLNEIFKKNSFKNVEKCKLILKRINEGIKILELNSNAQLAFKLMNKSMYLQQAHYKIEKNDFHNEINYNELLNKNIKNPKGNWFPFQIAFILLTIKSFTDPESDDRKIMDLIWFPTGGG